MRGEGREGRRDVFAGGERRGRAAEGGVGIGCECVSAARGEVSAGGGDAGLLAVDGIVGRDGRDGAGIVGRWERRGVVDGLAGGKVAGGPAVVERRVGRGVDGEERVLGELVAEMVVAHVGGEERAVVEGGDGVEVDGVAHALRDDGWMLAVGIHADDGGAEELALLTIVAG